MNMCRIIRVIIATVLWILAAHGNLIRNEDICGAHNSKRLYLELGEKGILYAKNVTFIRNSPRQQTSRFYTATNSSHHRCNLELVTCPSCVIIVIFKNIALQHHCGDGNVIMDTSCRCDYVWLSEPPYEDVSGSPFCGSYAPIMYRSSTRTLSINLLYSQSYKHAFTVEYMAERNRLHLNGTEMASTSIKGFNETEGGILTSPFFPARYPLDLGLEYIITCPVKAPFCRIRLLFSDFQLSAVSIMEFYDWNGQRLDVSSGVKFRPPVILSSGSSLLIRFYANGGTGLGYKAFYSFVIGHMLGNSIQPITDCGGYVENLGGTITMMDMVSQDVKIYDCVWLIRPAKNLLHVKTHVYLKVVTFTDMAGNTELIIKQGPTSALMPLEVIRHPASQLQPLKYKEHIVPISNGFHVSLRGTFGSSSYLAIAYSVFNYMDCYAGTDFLCQNRRCILSQFNCDGFDHCGDNSDEPTTCFADWEIQSHDRKWHTNKANYYFPKIERYPDLKTATVIFIASSFGLIVLISALIILLYKIRAKARQQRELQSRLETISELLDAARIDEISTPDDPPGYEAPPGYEEVVILAAQKKMQCLNRDSYNRNSLNQYNEDMNSSVCLESTNTDNNDEAISIMSENEKHLPESLSSSHITAPGTVPKNVIAIGLSASMRHICPVRRIWLRRSAQFSHPLPNDPLSISSSSSAEDFDKYLMNRIVLNQQSDNSPQKIKCIQQADQAVILVDNSHHISGQISNRLDNKNIDCSCEGACGCAINSSNLQNLPVNTSSISVISTSINNYEISRNQTAICSSVQKTNEYQIEDFSIPKNSIIKFLGSIIKPSHSLSWIATTVSTSSDNLSLPSKKLPTYSCDNCIAKMSTISACSSYEKLQEEFEILAETSNITCTASPRILMNTLNNTSKIISNQTQRTENRRHFNCDLDSLHKNIKILDMYMTEKKLNVDHGPCTLRFSETLP